MKGSRAEKRLDWGTPNFGCARHTKTFLLSKTNLGGSERGRMEGILLTVK